MRARRSSVSIPTTLFTWGVLVLLLLLVLLPFYWILNTSLKTMAQIQRTEGIYVPRPFTLEHYRDLFRMTHFTDWLRNSAMAAIGTTLLTILISSLAAYSISRLTYPGRRVLATWVMITYLIPPSLLFIPLYTILRQLKLVNTLWALLVSYPTFTVPFCTWLLMGFFKSIPSELEDAALVDGATRFQAFLWIILPLAAPGILAASLFSFTLAWNEFLYALIFVQNVELKTVPVGLNDLLFGDIFLWGQLMAAATVTTLPVVILYIYLHRYMVEGAIAGAVKG
ncbi:MAG: carbohydrate ABC transporter permease [candidate division NC10 bacterium]|nr:carbohydrate ABC transporter permease [candidate division NC10 bacterium]